MMPRSRRNLLGAADERDLWRDPYAELDELAVEDLGAEPLEDQLDEKLEDES